MPEIDSSSNEGEVPDRFDSTVQFNNVSFKYPSRPDVPVGATCTMYVSILALCIVVTALHGHFNYFAGSTQISILYGYK